MSIDLAKFYHEELEPKAFPHIDEMFPDFVLRGRKWVSPYKLDGVTPSHDKRKDKCYISDPQGMRYSHIRVGEQGGETIDLLELVQRRKNLDFVEAVKYVAQVVGEEIPQGASYDQEKAKKRKETQNQLNNILSQMKKALFAPEGASVLRYLKEERGYSDEYIKAQPFGYIDTNMECFRELCRLLSYHSERENQDKYPYYSKKYNKGVGITNTFAIAYIADGDIRGFAFRSVLSEGELKEREVAKYYSAYTSERDTQAYYPMALPTGKLTAYADQYLNFTLVEGELDTYRALYAGIPNVVGLSQGSLTADQLKKLKAKGAQSITLLMDTEERLVEEADPEKKRKASRERVKKAVNMIATQGLTPYVCYLPSTDDGKVDMDSYLYGLEGDELRAKGTEVQRMIEDAEGGYTFLYGLLQEQYEATRKNERDLKKFLHDTIILTQREECDLVERKEIYKRFADATGQLITAEDIEGTPTAEVEPDEEKERELRAKYRTIETTEERERRRSQKKPGIPTKYTFFAKNSSETEQLILPSGALTYVCLPTSHGKTRILENLALQIAMNEEKGSVLFFSVEEDADAVQDELLNIYHTFRNYQEPDSVVEKPTFQNRCERTHLSGNNLRTIRSHYAEADNIRKWNFFKGGLNSLEHTDLVASFRKSKEDFYSQYIDTERLKVFYEETRNVDKIIEGIKFLNKDLQTEQNDKPIKAVFIDYVQRLRKTGDFKGSRKEELTAVTNELMSLSIALQVPFVIAVQLNREAFSPLEMDVQNIADASEIELSGNLVLLGWNSSFNARAKTNAWYYKSGKERHKTDEAETFTNRTGVNLGEAGDLYLVTAKNRAGQRDFESRLYFDGNSGLILQGERVREERVRAENQAQVGGENVNESRPTKRQIKEQRMREAQEKAQQAFLLDDDPLGGARTDSEPPF